MTEQHYLRLAHNYMRLEEMLSVTPRIKSFPKDDRIWRLDWLGQIRRNRHQDSNEPNLARIVSPLKGEGANFLTFQKWIYMAPMLRAKNDFSRLILRSEGNYFPQPSEIQSKKDIVSSLIIRLAFLLLFTIRDFSFGLYWQ